PLIDPNVHSCGTVYPHGAGDLSHPEVGVILAGMNSYGRAPTFLALTGYEQVRSIAAHLAGDHGSATTVELALPETGVCSGGGLSEEPDASTQKTELAEPDRVSWHLCMARVPTHACPHPWSGRVGAWRPCAWPAPPA